MQNLHYEVTQEINEEQKMESALLEYYQRLDRQHYPVVFTAPAINTELTAAVWATLTAWINKFANVVAHKMQSTRAKILKNIQDGVIFVQDTCDIANEKKILSDQLTIQSLAHILLFMDEFSSMNNLNQKTIKLITCSALMLAEQQYSDLHEDDTHRELIDFYKKAAHPYTEPHIDAIIMKMVCARTTTLVYEHSHGWMRHLLIHAKKIGRDSSSQRLEKEAMALLRIALFSLRIARQSPCLTSMAVLLTLRNLSIETVFSWVNMPITKDNTDILLTIMTIIVDLTQQDFIKQYNIKEIVPHAMLLHVEKFQTLQSRKNQIQEYLVSTEKEAKTHKQPDIFTKGQTYTPLNKASSQFSPQIIIKKNTLLCSLYNIAPESKTSAKKQDLTVLLPNLALFTSQKLTPTQRKKKKAPKAETTSELPVHQFSQGVQSPWQHAYARPS